MILPLLLLLGSGLAEKALCEPDPAIQREIAKAREAAAGPSYEEIAAPLRELRDRFPLDLFVHHALQEAAFAHGTEGNLKALLAEYGRLRAEHPGETLYVHLSGSAMMGRGTRRAIAAMRDALALDPDFAPAHRALAEVYGSAMFGDAQQERIERARFNARCPGSAIAQRPPPLPPRSSLLSRMEPAPLAATPAEVERALQEEEARVMRMRLFDWYSPEEKQRSLGELQAAYWTGWSLIVRHHRRAGRPQLADAMLADMEERLLRLRRRPDPNFSLAARTLLGLYAEAKQAPRVSAALEKLRAVGGGTGPEQEAELAGLEAAFAASR
jgi:hypothetical protein